MSETDAVNLLGVAVSTLTLDEVVKRIRKAAASRSKAVFDYANIHVLNLAYRDPWLSDFYGRADLVFCDGVGVQWGALLLGRRIPERFTPPDWLPQLAQVSVENSFSLFLLGGEIGVAEKAAASLQTGFPRLNISGTHHGFFDKDRNSKENRDLVAIINRAAPDILIVGFGIPLQERWISENLDFLNVGICMAAGAMVDYAAGTVARGPRWITDHGFEWLSRLLVEPRRMWRRYLLGIPIFFFRVLSQRLRGLPAEENT